MAKPRKELTGAEVESLYENLDRELDGIGIQTQPEVAMRVLELVSDPESSMNDFARVIGGDPGLSGRLLKLANSAYYAQRQPVTALNRACVVVGLERLRAIVLGFYLCRAASANSTHDLARVVWGQSLFRACLAQGLARKLLRSRSAEAFVVGLMLDCGIPLSERMLKGALSDQLADDPAPQTLFCRELTRLEFTHVDVAVALCRRWELPGILAVPITSHHLVPKSAGRKAMDEVERLRRIGFAAGAIRLDSDAIPIPTDAMPASGIGAVGLSASDVSKVVKDAVDEYKAVGEVFSDFADEIDNLESLSERVSVQMQTVLDAQIAASIRTDTTPHRFHLDIERCVIEIEPRADGTAIAYLLDSSDRAVASHIFSPRTSGVEDIIYAFALENAPDDKIIQIAGYLTTLAA